MRKFTRKVYILGMIFALVAALNAYVGLRYVTAPVKRELERNMEAELDFVIGEIDSAFTNIEQTLDAAGYYIAMGSETEKIERLLDELKRQNSSYLAVYLGIPNEDISAPWYTAAVTEGGAAYTANYGDGRIVTVSKPIFGSAQELLGVVAIDVPMENLMASFDAGQVGQDGNFLLLVEDGRFLDNWSYGGLDLGLFAEPMGMTEFRLGDTRGYLRWKTAAESAFIVATFAPEGKLFDRQAQTQRFMVLTALPLVAGSLLVFIFLRLHIVIPMRELGNDLMAISLDRDAGYRLPVGKNNSLGVFRQALNVSLRKAQEHHEYVSNQRAALSEAYIQLKEHEETLQKQYMQIKKNEERIRFLAEYDSLTKLPNRRKFQADLQETLDQGGSGAIFLLDVDDFKNINDTQGHSYGDRVLLSIARLLEKELPPGATVYRFGGDEFMIIVRHKFATERVQVYVTEITKKLRSIVLKEEKRSSIACSMGISRYPLDGTTPDELLIKVDVALHHAKSTGKDRFCFFEESMAAMFNERVHLEGVLAEAVRTGSFHLVYQPIVDIHRGRVVSFEALIRLENHDVSPSIFIPIAEELDLIIPLGYWVIKEVVQQLALWQKEGRAPKAVSVNLSPKQFHDPHLIDYIREQLDATGVDPALFEVEFPEAVLLGDAESALRTMEEIQSMGISQSLDNYGIGYSFINYMTRLPVDYLKIHGTLTENIVKNPHVMDGLIAIAHGLQMEVVAVQVEGEEEAQALYRANCDYLQGFLVSGPVRAGEAELMFESDYADVSVWQNEKES